tara:strand:+ start:176 stop:679 length:504 start_codon:yes stop_codon:yes gene_type:complete
MIFTKKHNTDLYNTLLSLSRNIFFYKKLKLVDSFETRVYLMLFHFSIILLIFKRKSLKFNQDKYDSLFHNIENNLRELGFGDISVNKKMKDLNKILYDILLKINIKGVEKFEINENLLTKYFNNINTSNNRDLVIFKEYFIKFYDFCFELSPDIMVREAIKFDYGSS